MRAIGNVQVVTPSGVLPNGAVIFDKYIQWIGPMRECDLGLCDIEDGKGLFLGPGLIDMHVHGIAGADVSDGSVLALNTMSKALARHGVTAFLPTTLTASWPMIRRSLEAIRAAQHGVLCGATVVGAHLEGPFLSPERVGAHSIRELQGPSFTLIEEFLDVIRVLTFAPELPGAEQLMREVAAFPEIILSIGHSNATFEQARVAMQAGIRHATHLFNAMSPLLHREPGVVGAVLAGQLSAELIADNVHVHPGLYGVLLKILGPDQLILVSDSMRGAGLSEGTFDLGGQSVTVTHGAARLPGGQLAGSVTTLNQAVKNFSLHTGLALPEAISFASQNPARLLGLKQKGSVETGKDADLILFDKDFNVHATMVGGKFVFRDR